MILVEDASPAQSKAQLAIDDMLGGSSGYPDYPQSKLVKGGKGCELLCHSPRKPNANTYRAFVGLYLQEF
ncbi:hypothetical protein GCM10027577_35200 [Spirosoma fluminis]